MTVFECCNDMFILDCGLAFPDMDMPGVDIVIPDFTYVEANRDKIRGIVLTHGHEDHIGALPAEEAECAGLRNQDDAGFGKGKAGGTWTCQFR